MFSFFSLRLLIIVILIESAITKFFYTLKYLFLNKKKIMNNEPLWVLSIGAGMGDAVVESYIFNGLKTANNVFFDNLKIIRITDKWKEIFSITGLDDFQNKNFINDINLKNMNYLFSFVNSKKSFLENYPNFSFFSKYREYKKQKKYIKMFIQKNNIKNIIVHDVNFLALNLSIYSINTWLCLNTIWYPKNKIGLLKNFFIFIYSNIITIKKNNKVIVENKSINDNCTIFKIWEKVYLNFFNVLISWEKPSLKTNKTQSVNTNYLVFLKSSTKLKDWPYENWPKLIKLINQKTNFHPIFIDTKKDMIIENLFEKNYTSKYNLTTQELIEIISHCQFCISNDTGPAHLANLLGIKTYVINPELWNFWPYPKNLSILNKGYPTLLQMNDKELYNGKVSTLYDLNNVIGIENILSKITPELLFNNLFEKP